MGFQLVFLNYSVEDSEHFSGTLDLGGDQIVICATYVHLTATVAGDDITNHTTLWEQMSGSPITFIGDPNNTLTISYEQTAIKDDKRFRFWIDKGTENEMYADVMVYGTITDVFKMTTAYTPIVDTDSSADGYTIQSSQLYAFLAAPNYVIPRTGLVIANNPNVMIGWNLTGQQSSSIASVTVQENTTGVWVPKQVVAGGTNQYGIASLNASYRLDGTYSFGRVPQTYIGVSTRFTMNQTLELNDRLDLVTVGGTAAEVATTYTSRSKVTYNIPNEQLPLALVGGGLEGPPVVTSRTKITYNVPYETMTMTTTNESLVTDITQTVTLKTRAQVGG